MEKNNNLKLEQIVKSYRILFKTDTAEWHDWIIHYIYFFSNKGTPQKEKNKNITKGMCLYMLLIPVAIKNNIQFNLILLVSLESK